MRMIEVSEDALASIRRMGQDQADRITELEAALREAHTFLDDLPHAHIAGYRAQEVRLMLRKSIALLRVIPNVQAPGACENDT